MIDKKFAGLATPSVVALFAVTWLAAGVARGHMPWLDTDADGHAMVWFGESLADRVYHMPETVAAIKLRVDGDQDTVLETQPVDSDTLLGIRSKLAADIQHELYGSVTYGLYHGTKLTYHVEHLPHADSDQWPAGPRKTKHFQSVISRSDNLVIARVYRDMKPAAAVEVKLLDNNGQQVATETTDAEGLVRFNVDQVAAGLCGLVVGETDSSASGQYQGQPYSSTSDYLTSTFYLGQRDDDANKSSTAPVIDPGSKVSVRPSVLPDLPEELTSFGAAVVDQTLFVYGGHTGSAHSYSTEEQSERLWSLDLSNWQPGQQPDAKWQNVGTGPRLQGLAMVGFRGRLIRVGGFTAVNERGQDHDLRSQDSVSAYDPRSQKWFDLPSLPEPRSSLDAAIMHDTLYVVGGWQLIGQSDTARWHQTAWSLDLSQVIDQNGQPLADPASWRAIANPPFQRRALSVAAHDGKVYAIGGMESDNGPTTKVGVYDPQTDSWSQGPALPGQGMSGFGSSAFAVGPQLLVSTYDGSVHQLSGSASDWQTIAKTDPARFFHRMVPVGSGRLLMLGGANMSIGKFTNVDLIQLDSDR